MKQDSLLAGCDIFSAFMHTYLSLCFLAQVLAFLGASGRKESVLLMGWRVQLLC